MILLKSKKPTKWVKIKALNNWESITYETSDGVKFTEMQPNVKFWFMAPDATEFQAMPIQEDKASTYTDWGRTYTVRNNIISVPVRFMGVKMKVSITDLRLKV